MSEQYPENIQNKKNTIEKLLKDINFKSMKYYKRYKKLKKITKILKGLITALNAVSVSSIILMLNPISPVFMFTALVSSSISGIIQAVISSIEIENMYNSDNTSYLQYTDLFRNINNILLKNNLSSNDFDNLLVSINEKLGLIEDKSNAI